jgi:hypothetical protein
LGFYFTQSKTFLQEKTLSMGGFLCKPDPQSLDKIKVVNELSQIIDQTTQTTSGMLQIYDDLRHQLAQHKTMFGFYKRFSGTKLWVDNMLHYSNTRNYIQSLLVLTLHPNRFKATQNICTAEDVALWFTANSQVDAIGDRDVIWAAILCNFILGQECSNSGVVCVVPTAKNNFFSPFALFKNTCVR